MSYWYSTGTLSVANGATTVTGTLTGWNSTVRAGDFLFIGDNTAVEVGAVVDNVTLTLARPWPFTTVTNGSYAIAQGLLWNDVTRLAQEVANALANSTQILSGIGVPSNSLGTDGSAYFRQDAPELYFKTGASWGAAISLVGPQGPAGATNITTSTTSRTIGTGTMSFTVAAGLALQTGMRMRATSGANYMEGPIASYSGTTLSITMDRFVGSGSFASWNIAPVGDKGDSGAAGPGYNATSTSSVAIGTGSKALSIGTGYAFATGQRARAARDTSNYIEGLVASYTGGTLTITADRAVGSGTYTSWTLGLAGDPGGQGIQGIQGNPGPPNVLGIGTITTGAPGSSADATITGTSPAQTLNLTIPRGADGTNGTNGTNGAPGSVLTATSTTSVTTATGDRTFTLAAVADFLVNQRVRAASNATPDNWMSGRVKSWNSGTKVLVVTVDLIGSAPATATDWNISVTGEKGDQGPAGGFGSLSAAKGTIPVGDGTVFGAMAIGADGTVPIADSTKTYGFSWLAEDAINAGPYWTASDIASAATCDIGAATTSYVRITGTTTITSLGAGASKFRFVEFTGSLTLTYNGTSLILPGASNIITAAGDKGIFVSDASGNWKCVCWTLIGSRPRETLLSNRTYYVNKTTGSNSNNGLSSGAAFSTIQKAIDVACALDLSVYSVTINVADATGYAGFSIKPFVGVGPINIIGNTTTPSNVDLSGSTTNISGSAWNCRYVIKGMKIANSAGNGVALAGPGSVTLNNMEFGACTGGSYVRADDGCFVNIRTTSITVSGAAAIGWLAGYGSQINFDTTTITYTASVAYGTANFYVQMMGFIMLGGVTFTLGGNTVTGQRYSTYGVAFINTYNQGANFIPGSIAGTSVGFQGYY